MPSYTPLNQPQGNAPPARQAPQPGMGRGNVPFAPGVMSGNLGGNTAQTPLARQTTNQPPPRPIQGSPPPAPRGQVPQAAPPGGAASQPGMPDTRAMAMFYMQFLESWLLMIKNSTDKPLVGGMY